MYICICIICTYTFKVLASFEGVPVKNERFFRKKRSTRILIASSYYPVNTNLKLFLAIYSTVSHL